MATSTRTALLVRCSVEEAAQIRAAAKKSDRTLSGYILHCLRNRLRVEAELDKDFPTLAKGRSTRSLRDSTNDRPKKTAAVELRS